MKEFKYNDIGVCLNPEVEVIHDCKKYLARISLGERKGKWSFGFYFCLKFGTYSGYSTGVSFSNEEMIFESMEEARCAAINKGLKLFKAHPIAIHSLKAALTPQLSLFERN